MKILSQTEGQQCGYSLQGDMGIVVFSPVPGTQLFHLAAHQTGFLSNMRGWHLWKPQKMDFNSEILKIRRGMKNTAICLSQIHMFKEV